MDGVRVELDDIALINLRHVLDNDCARSIDPVRRQECICAAQADDSFKHVPETVPNQ